MVFNVLTLFPKLFDGFKSTGVIGKAFDKDIARLNLINPRDFALDKHRSVDHPPYGGGDGMLMMGQPLFDAVKSVSQKSLVINMSPQGKPWNQKEAQVLVKEHTNLTIVCGRYAGVDQRFINSCIDLEYSLGDYVISGGEIASQIIMDSVMRLLPGTLGHKKSAIEDSFSNQLLEAPQYTQPREFLGQNTPQVLLSGHHKNIIEWNENLSYCLTYFKRRDLLLGQSQAAKNVLKSMKYMQQFSDIELMVFGLNDAQVSLVKTLTLEDIKL